MNPLGRQITEAIRQAIIQSESFVPLHEPRFEGNEAKYVQECIDSTFVSSVGKFVDRFEKDLADYTGAENAIAVVNGTAALHVALLLAGVEAGDEVLIPALSFVATANAVRYCGAIPHFVDCEEETLGLDPDALSEHLREVSIQKAGKCINRKTGRRIRVLVPMHTFGHPCNLDGLLSVTKDFNLILVEDAAESLGSWYKGQHTGTFGRMGTLSFNGNKTLTTGGGGAILTNDSNLAKRAKHITTTAKVPHRWEYVHDEVGFNYRLPNLNAALGCAQLEQMPEFLASKRRLFKRYNEVLQNIPEVNLVREPQGCRSNYWLQTLLLDETAADQRDSVLGETNSGGFMTRPAWTLLNLLQPYRDCPRSQLPAAESLARRIINIPSSAGLA